MRVLIIEDDPLLAMDLEDTLQAAGFEVQGSAASVEQGLLAIDRSPPEVATLDYHLGRETSEAVAKRLRSMNIPYCYISGHGDHLSNRENAPVIAKPANPGTVVRTVRELALQS